MIDRIKKNYRPLLFVIMIVLFGIVDPHKESGSHRLFYYIIVGEALFLCLFNKRYGNEYIKKSIICIITTTVCFIALVGARWHFRSDFFLRSIARDDYTTMIERALGESNVQLLDSTFKMYYFKDQTITCCDDDTQSQVERQVTGGSFYKCKVLSDRDIVANTTLMQIADGFPRYIDELGNIYVVDDGIREKSLVCVNRDDKLVYCSKAFYLSSLDNSTNLSDYVEQSNTDAMTQLARLTTNYDGDEHISNTMRVQMVAVAIFFAIGLIICMAFFNELGGWMISMLSIPIGTVCWSIVGIIILVFRLPYNIYTQSGILLSLLLLLIYKRKDIILSFRYKELCIPCSVLLFSLIYYSTTSRSISSFDSIKKLQLGFMLAIDHKPYLQFTNVAIFGMIEPFIHSLGYMCGGDFLYTIYPMFNIVIIGLIIGGLYKRFENQVVNIISISKGIFKPIACFIVLAIGILLNNTDFGYARFYIMSHIIVAAYFLIFVYFMLCLKDGNCEFAEWGLFFSTIAIIISRTEGIIYILFFLTFMVGHINNKKFVRASYVTCALCLAWVCIQLVMYNGDDGEGYFFSIGKGVILIIGAIVTIAYVWLYPKIMRRFLHGWNYTIAYLLLMLLAITLISVMVGEMATENLSVYVSHLSSYIEKDLNAGYFWSFVLLSILYILRLDNDLAELSVGVILGYLELVFLIFLFRHDLPMHESIGDSGRRMLVHIMPSSIFLLLSTIIDVSTENKNVM